MIRLACFLFLLSGLQSVQAQQYTQPPYAQQQYTQQQYQQDSRLSFDKGASAAQVGDYAEAYCIWKPLANGGHIEAQYRLGWLYAKGLGLAVNETLAIHWWKQAAEQGHTEALFSLGWAYEHGDGIKKDIAQAMSYYLQAAAQGQEDAIEILQLMLMRDNKEVTEGVGQLLQKNPGALGELRKIAVTRANVRKGSDKNAKLLRTLKQDDALVVLGNQGNWLRIWMVEHQQFGWIFKRLVSGYDK